MTAPLPSCTDTANAKRFADRFAGRVLFVHGAGGDFRGRDVVAHVYNGTRWARDPDGKVMRLAREAVLGIADEAKGASNEEQKALLAHMVRSLEEPRLRRLVALATSEAGLVARLDQLDADPWRLNCPNGTLDLRTGMLKPHDAKDLLSKVAGAPYDPEAACEGWERFLARVLPERSVRDYLQRAVGYALTGLTVEQILLFLFGTGANGKTVCLEVLRRVVADYAKHASFETLLASRPGGGPREDMARLAGARLVTANELEPGQRFAESTIKQLTGSDTVTARHLYTGSFEFVPQAKFVLAGNHKPRVRDSSEGMWRRLRLVPFTVTIPEYERDPYLADKLFLEAPGILAWAVRGCTAWQAQRLGTPPAVAVATEEYRRAEDIVGEYLEERCDPAVADRVSASELYKNFRAWAEARGERPMSQKALGDELTSRGFLRLSIDGRVYYRGMRLAAAA